MSSRQQLFLCIFASMNKLAEWYAQGQDFDDGYHLLFAQNPIVAIQWQEWVGRQYVPTFYRQQLRIALDALPLTDFEFRVSSFEIPEPQNSKPEPQNLKPEPAIIQQYRRLWYENSNRYRRHHAMMSATLTDSVRGEQAKIIMADIIPERTRISAVLDAYEKNGTLPETAQNIETVAVDYEQGLRDGAATLQRIFNLTTRINLIDNQLIPKARSASDADRVEALEKERLLKTAQKAALKQKLGLANE